MSDIFDYLYWRGDLPLRRSPFNPADGAILAQLAYAPFADLKPEFWQGSPTLGDACRELASHPDLQERTLLKDDPRLIRPLADSPRFSDMPLCDHADLLDEASETQFSATTFRLGEGLWYIAFRGTDETVTGWKEDFNMSFTLPVPAQALAEQYLRAAAGNLPGRLILGGHSKGGNLAVYAAAACPEEVRERIARVYNFDGPGFEDSFLETPGFRALQGRVETFVPQSSVVGLLLGHEETHTVVKSGSLGPLQHNLYTWHFAREGFVELETVTRGSQVLDRTLKNWLRSLTLEQREIFVDAFFSLLETGGVQDLREIPENLSASAKALPGVIRDMDPQTRKVLLDCLAALAKAAKDAVLQG